MDPCGLIQKNKINKFVHSSSIKTAFIIFNSDETNIWNTQQNFFLFLVSAGLHSTINFY